VAAYDVTLDNGTRTKHREPGLVLLWTFITFGIYNLVWYYKINRELRDFGRAKNDEELGSSSPGMSLLAVTLGALIIVPPFVSWWRCTRRIERAQGLAGVNPVSFGLIIGLMFGGILIGALWLAIPLLIQEELNKIWDGHPRAVGAKGTVDASAAVGSQEGGAPVTESLPSRGDVKMPEQS
jgi:hypothetical protein